MQGAARAALARGLLAPLRGRFCLTLAGKRRQECGGGSSELALRGAPRRPPTPTAQGGPSILVSGRLCGGERGRLRTQWDPGPGLQRCTAVRSHCTAVRSHLPRRPVLGPRRRWRRTRGSAKAAFLPPGPAACGLGCGPSQMCRDVRHSMMGLGGSCPRAGPRFPPCEQARRRVLQRVSVSVNREGVCQVCSGQTRHQSELLPQGPESPQALVKSGWDAGMTGLTHGHGLAFHVLETTFSSQPLRRLLGFPAGSRGNPALCHLAHGWG